MIVNDTNATSATNATPTEKASISPDKELVQKTGQYYNLKSLFQALRNNQHCYAAAASIVRVSKLRKVFELKELERSLFLNKLSHILRDSDYTLEFKDFYPTVFWFASIEIFNASQQQLHNQIIDCCIASEKAIADACDQLLATQVDSNLLTKQHQISFETIATLAQLKTQ